MRVLRLYIRQLLQEVYELSDKERKFAKSMGLDPEEGFAAGRALGLQSSKEIIQDRTDLQNYQQRLKSTSDGKKLIKQFMEGKDVTIMHGINYTGYAVNRGLKSRQRVDLEMPFQRWIGKHGRKGKDVLSVTASDKPLGQSFMYGVMNNDVPRGFGFIMKGYPVYISEYDVMSQTLGALPAGLVKHQAQSGIAKRPGDTTRGITKPGFHWAGEALLDNWEIIGTYMSIGNLNLNQFHHLAQDSLKIHKPLPMYVYDDGRFIGIIKDQESYLSVREDSFGIPASSG